MNGITNREEELEEKAKWVRRKTLEMCVSAKCGHTASSFSCVEILVALYYGGLLKFDPNDSQAANRDRFILSKGHGGIALYPILADLGFFPVKELDNFCRAGCALGTHPDINVPGVEIVTGSLGNGLGIAAGLALCAKIDNDNYIVTVLLGDGECYEGSVWEAAMFAGGHRLKNLVAIIDRNQLSATDFTEIFLPMDPLQEKWEAFNWDVVIIDGHSFKEINCALGEFRSNTSDKPLMLICNTVKGKGVSYMENAPLWHTLLPSNEQVETALKELGSE